MNSPANALTIRADGFDLVAADPSASPIRGTDLKFKDGAYFSYGDEVDVHDQTFAVIDRASGWQKLQRDCSPEWCVQLPGAPRPSQPHVDKADWPKDFNGNPAHPWKWTHYIYLLNAATGEMSTFSTGTIGGNLAVKDLSEQICLMRQLRPGAVPIISLQAKDMPTSFGGTKPRPHFKIAGWRARESAGPQTLITGPGASGELQKPTTEELLNDSLPF